MPILGRPSWSVKLYVYRLGRLYGTVRSPSNERRCRYQFRQSWRMRWREHWVIFAEYWFNSSWMMSSKRPSLRKLGSKKWYDGRQSIPKSQSIKAQTFVRPNTIGYPDFSTSRLSTKPKLIWQRYEWLMTILGMVLSLGTKTDLRFLLNSTRHLAALMSAQTKTRTIEIRL